MTESKEVIKKQDAGVAEPTSEVHPSVLVQMALDKNLDVEKLERVIALQERMEERDAAKQFNQALALFQQECPPIPKSSKAGATRGGGLHWDYAKIETILDVIGPKLREHGLSVAWETDESERGMMKVGCVVRHVGGHEYRPPPYVTPIADNKGVNVMQQHGSAWSYARRVAMMGALGLVAGGEDNDGAGGEKTETITLDQQEDIRQRMDRLNASDRAWQSFLGIFGVSSLADVPAHEYQRADQILAAKERK